MPTTERKLPLEFYVIWTIITVCVLSVFATIWTPYLVSEFFELSYHLPLPGLWLIVQTILHIFHSVAVLFDSTFLHIGLPTAEVWRYVDEHEAQFQTVFGRTSSYPKSSDRESVQTYIVLGAFLLCMHYTLARLVGLAIGDLRRQKVLKEPATKKTQ